MRQHRISRTDALVFGSIGLPRLVGQQQRGRPGGSLYYAPRDLSALAAQEVQAVKDTLERLPPGRRPLLIYREVTLQQMCGAARDPPGSGRRWNRVLGFFLGSNVPVLHVWESSLGMSLGLLPATDDGCATLSTLCLPGIPDHWSVLLANLLTNPERLRVQQQWWQQQQQQQQQQHQQRQHQQNQQH